MKLDNILELYQLISNGTKNIPIRNECIKLRKIIWEAYKSPEGFTKLAFDTRRIDQETEYNPRRGLQNYSRSEAFLSEAMAEKIIHFAKLKTVLDGLKKEYGKEHEWQDSNARVLLSTLENGLRTNQNDGDFSETQSAQGSLRYIEELLHVRYRLGFDSLASLSNAELKKIILSKDEELINKNINETLQITKSDISKNGYDGLMEKLFGNVKASAENKHVKRIVNITIEDKFIEE